MTPLIELLLAAGLLGLLGTVATGCAVSVRCGFGYSASARDAQIQLDGVPARIVRASHNFHETFIFFVVAVVVAHLLGRETPLAVWGAWAYLLGRLMYWPLYVAGVPVIRSLVWVVSVAGILMVGAAAALG